MNACPWRVWYLWACCLCGCQHEHLQLWKTGLVARTPVDACPYTDSSLAAGASSAPDRTGSDAGPPSVALVSYQAAEEALPPPAEAAAESLPLAAADATTSPLRLPEVLASVHQTFPLLQAAMAEREILGGKAVGAWGEFDRTVEMHGIATPQGYYKNYRSGVGLQQPLWSGGFVFGGYRNGSGYFPDWYKNRLTNEGGEFRLGLGVPLAQGRAIDKRRAGVLQTSLAREAVEPDIQAQVLEYSRAASEAYWSWVAAGRMLQAQRELLLLARDRVKQIDDRIRSGDLERNARIDNERLIASRETKLIESERKLQASAIELSLFLRTADGQPLVPGDTRLPEDFPGHAPPNPDHLEADIQAAEAARPELIELDLLRQQVCIELRQAQNMRLPKVDAILEATKDVGAAADVKEDKTPFQLEAGLLGEVPLQRREARGKIQAAQGKLSQIAAKREFTANKIVAEVRDAVSALTTAHGRIQRAQVTHQLAHESLELGRQGFKAGDLTVVTLNLYEQAILDAELQLIDAQADYFKALASYRAALAIDPLTE